MKELSTSGKNILSYLDLVLGLSGPFIICFWRVEIPDFSSLKVGGILLYFTAEAFCSLFKNKVIIHRCK